MVVPKWPHSSYVGAFIYDMYLSTWHRRRSRVWSEGCMCLGAMFKGWACPRGMAFWGWSGHAPTRHVEKMSLPLWHGLLFYVVFVWKAPSLDWVALDYDQHCIYTDTSYPGSRPCVKLRLDILMKVTFHKGCSFVALLLPSDRFKSRSCWIELHLFVFGGCMINTVELHWCDYILRNMCESYWLCRVLYLAKYGQKRKRRHTLVRFLGACL